MKHMLLAAKMASQGMTSVTPEGTITKDNAAEWQKVFEARQRVYNQAAEARGVANFAGVYRYSSSSGSCPNAQSFFVSTMADQRSARRLTVTQSGTELQMKFGDTRFETVDGYAVEKTIAFADPMNMDYTHLAHLNGDELVIRPQPEVLGTWPEWAGPPKAEDIQSCRITLTRQKG